MWCQLLGRYHGTTGTGKTIGKSSGLFFQQEDTSGPRNATDLGVRMYRISGYFLVNSTQPQHKAEVRFRDCLQFDRQVPQAVFALPVFLFSFSEFIDGTRTMT